MLPRLFLLFIGLLAVPANAVAKDTKPRWDCDVEVKEGREWWSVSKYSARWTYWTENRARLIYSGMIYDDHDKHHFVQEGPLSPWMNSYLSVSPKTTRVKGKLWANIAVEGKALPGKRIRTHRGFYGSAMFPIKDLRPYFDDATTIIAQIYDRKANVIETITVPVSQLREATRKLVPMQEELEARLANPESSCRDLNDVMIVPH